MKEFLKIIFERIISPIFVVILTPIIAATVSKIRTGSWIEYFNKIPFIYYYFFLGFIVTWFMILLIKRRIEKIKKENAYVGPFVVQVPMWGYIKFAEIELFNVKWKIKAPAPPPFLMKNFDPDNISPEEIDIDMPPRCPKCGTELEEKKNFWGRYKWNCVGCGFSTSSKESYYIVADKVKRIVKRQFEMKKER